MCEGFDPWVDIDENDPHRSNLQNNMVRYHNVTGIESFSLLYFMFFGKILLNFKLVFFSRQKKPRFITLPYSSSQDCS